MPDSVYEFGSFRLNLAERRFRENGDEIVLPPKVFEVLSVLLDRSGQLVTYAELMESVWPATSVEEGNLRYCIHSLRRIIGSDAIETVPKHGYRFVLPVTLSPPNGEHHTSSTSTKAATGRLGRYAFIAIGLVLIGLTAGTLFFINRKGDSTPTEAKYLKRIAVAPFSVILDDPGSHITVQRGIGEALTYNLKLVQGIGVSDFHEIEPFFGKAVDPAAFARDLKAGSVLTGSLREEHGSLRVSFELVNVADHTKELSDSFIVSNKRNGETETEVALRIARKIDIKIAELRDEASIPDAGLSQEARSSYLMAQRLPREFDLNRWSEATSLMKKVVESAPDWGRGHAKLAEALVLVQDPGSCVPARESADRALALDPSSAEAYLVIGVCDINENKWDAGESALKKSIEIDPTLDRAYFELGQVLDFQRRFAEAETYLKKGLELQPLAPYYNVVLCQHYYYDKKWTEALKYCERSQQIEPGYFLAEKRLYWLYVMQNRYDLVREITFGAASDEEYKRNPLALPLLKGDVRGYWAANLKDRLSNKRKRPSPIAIATYYAMLGDTENTLDLLDEGFAVNSEQMRYIYADPIWDSVRREPRYAALIRKLDLGDIQIRDEPSRSALLAK